MRNPLAVAVVQPVWAGPDVLANAERHAHAIEKAEARVLVFPELSLTGYDLDAQPLAVDDRRLRPITEACRSTGAVALVGAPVRDADGREYIATLAVTGEGTTVAYRKTYLHGPESDRFTPGEEPVVLTVDGWRLGLAVRYDAAVPQHAADTAALGIDAYVASAVYGPGPDSRARRDAHMRERALAHDMWVVLATAAGASGSFAGTSGGSGVWAPDGAVVAQADPEAGRTVACTIPTPA
ncbi:carbon-nitrogen hydrolase family protein [Streptomyces sp. NRRL B-24484]|uniref:carbon-nitrogen hydrolase family protein n=1 Tax=Streptomyces sp. NRRL B-24484 TaxID=1463833 RepID=UPI0004BE86DD|nr:carbon-nitrogen hydrolase family protein [Streptomyces sp. NRRL B-24484]